MNGFRIAGRYARTVRPLKPSQAAWRARCILRRRLGLHTRVALPREAPAFDAACLERLCQFAARWACIEPGIKESADELRRGRLTFLNERVESGEGLPWGSRGASRLWRYHLHYFGYARTLALANTAKLQEADRALVRGWIRDWIAKNPIGTDVAWDPYPISARLFNWALAEAVFQFDDEVMRRSFQQQAAYLRRNLEYDILANHLLKNAAALVLAGTLLDSPLRETGLTLLERELAEQVLPDGGHYERTPMYHCGALEDCLIAHAALPDPPGFLDEAIAKMTAFLGGICHPDGGIPLFGDTALNAGTAPVTLYALALEQCRIEAAPARESSFAFEDSGFYILGSKDGGSRMIVKAGSPGPGYQLGHAHADMLSYELSIDGRRVIVDSGVHGYEGSPYRDYCRATRAHNTVCVNGIELLETWAAFRVGRRYAPLNRVWNQNADGWGIAAGHDGFKPCRHVRCIFYTDGDCWVIGDRVTGPGKMSVESFIHFHPDLQIDEAEERWVVQGGGIAVTIVPFGTTEAETVCGATDPLQGWYCPEFGKAIPAPTLILRAAGASQLRFGYAIFPRCSSVPSREDIEEFAGRMDQDHDPR